MTPRANVVRALAIREAELLDQVPATAHVLVALIWEAGGLAARALADAGLAKVAEVELRRKLATSPDSARGLDAHDSLRAAAKLATALGHDYVGTEHQLLAIRDDNTLSEELFPVATREKAKARLDELLPKGTSED